MLSQTNGLIFVNNTEALSFKCRGFFVCFALLVFCRREEQKELLPDDCAGAPNLSASAEALSRLQLPPRASPMGKDKVYKTATVVF